MRGLRRRCYFIPRLFALTCAVMAVSAWAESTEHLPAISRSLTAAKEWYANAEFEQCLAELNKMPQEGSGSHAEQVEVELYRGLCAGNLGQRKAAMEHFTRALKVDRRAQLPPLTSPKLVQLFGFALSKLPPIAPEPPRAAPSGASDEEDAMAAGQHLSAAIALEMPSLRDSAMPKGIERLYTQPAQPEPSGFWKVAPWASGGLALAAGAGAMYFGLHSKSLDASAAKSHFDSDARRLHARAVRHAQYANICLATASAFATAALASYLWVHVFH